MSQPPAGPPTLGPGPEPEELTGSPAAEHGPADPGHDRFPVVSTLRISTAAPLLLVSGAAVGAFSVPKYDLRIVLAYVVLLAVLAVAAGRGLRHRPAADVGQARLAGALALAAAGGLIWTVPAFSYVTGTSEQVLRGLTAATALAAALLLALPWRPAPDVALTVALAGYAAVATAALRLDPAPRIDVWYTLQGAADGLRHGQDMYQQVWVGPPGPMPFFTYLPWTAVLVAPGRWLLGDVRWVLVAVTVATAVMFRMLALPDRPDGDRRAALTSAAGAAAILLLLPGTLTQIEQAWTEPLLLACLALALVGLSRGHGWLAVVGVALALACKQHVVLLLPVLAAWPRFGVRRAVAAALLAGGLVMPWLVADPGAIWHDTVTLLVNFPPLRFADTVYIAVLNEWGTQPPFWLTGAVVVGVVALAATVVRRHDPSAAVLLRWCALVLLVANLVNKQAFYNQYWLVAGLVLLSWAVAPHAVPRAVSPRPGPGT